MTSDPSHSNPPGPLNMLGATGLTWRHAFHLVFSPLQFMTAMTERYGDLTFFRLFGRRAYLLNHPDLIAQVLIHEADAFEKLPRQVNVVRQILGQGILVTEGQRWKLDRQHLQRAFGKSLHAGNIAATTQCTRRLLERWRNRDEVSLVQEMSRLTAEISSVLLVGEDDPKIVDQLAEAVMAMSDSFSSEMNSVFRLPDWLPLPNKRRKRKSIKVYNEFFDRLVCDRRTGATRRVDFLQYLIDQPQPAGTGPNFVRDQLLTVLIAAYHASSMALVWIFLLLDKHPDVEQRLIDELAQWPASARGVPEQILGWEYLRMVIAESLRLYPPAWALFARRSKREVHMRGFRIPAGGWFYISPFVTHRSERFFPDPLKFVPERFSPRPIHEIPEYAYFPFGLGGRSCIGSRLALDQLQLITALIIERFRLRGRERDKEPQLIATLSLRPRGDCRMQVQASTLPACSETIVPATDSVCSLRGMANETRLGIPSSPWPTCGHMENQRPY